MSILIVDHFLAHDLPPSVTYDWLLA